MTKRKAEGDATDTETEAASDAGTGDGAGGDGTSDGGERSLEDRLVARLRDLLPTAGEGASSDGDSGSDDGSDEGEVNTDTPRRASAAETELDFEAKVRTALARVRHEEETEHRLEHLEKSAAATKEVPPVKLSRITRMMWGERERSA